MKVIIDEVFMKSEFLIVAKRLMETERKSMSPRELVDLGHQRQLFSDNMAGKTPHQTMKAKLSVHIRGFAIRTHGSRALLLESAAQR